MSKKITESLSPVFYGDATMNLPLNVAQYIANGPSNSWNPAFDTEQAVVYEVVKSRPIVREAAHIYTEAEKRKNTPSKHFVKVSPSKKG